LFFEINDADGNQSGTWYATRVAPELNELPDGWVKVSMTVTFSCAGHGTQGCAG
jgi:hypothetical protein